jgi:hypothetical protein
MEPISLAVVGAAVLTEGVKFLYAQAGAAIQRWREKRDEPVPIAPDAPIEGELRPAKLDAAAMEQLEGDISTLRKALGPYVDDVDPNPVDPKDLALVEVAEGLRRSLEAVLGQRIRFTGEGEPSGPLIEGTVNADDVAGYVAGVRGRALSSDGTIIGRVTVKKVEAGGQAIGVDLDNG